MLQSQVEAFGNILLVEKWILSGVSKPLAGIFLAPVKNCNKSAICTPFTPVKVHVQERVTL